jgi:hypothetical protein
MNNFLQSLLDLSKNEPKDNYIHSEHSGCSRGIAGAVNSPFYGKSNRYYEQSLLTWLCTDTTVGICAHYLDNNLLAISYQTARKSYQHHYFASKEMLQKFEEFLAYDDENLDDLALDKWEIKKERLTRELAFVENRIDDGESYNCDTIDSVNWLDKVKDCLKSNGNAYYRHNNQHWENVEKLVKQYESGV